MSVHEPTDEQRRAVAEAIDPLATEYEPEGLVPVLSMSSEPLRCPCSTRLEQFGSC